MKWGEERGLRVSTELPSGAPEQAGFPVATFHICPGGAAIKTSLPRGRLCLAGRAGFGRDFGPGLVNSRALPLLSDRPWPTLVPQKWASGGPPGDLVRPSGDFQFTVSLREKGWGGGTHCCCWWKTAKNVLLASEGSGTVYMLVREIPEEDKKIICLVGPGRDKCWLREYWICWFTHYFL